MKAWLLSKVFWTALNVTQAGFPAVALMGSSLSQPQEELLARRFKRVALMFDGDEAGRTATQECLQRLAKRLWVRTIILPDNQ